MLWCALCARTTSPRQKLPDPDTHRGQKESQELAARSIAISKAWTIAGSTCNALGIAVSDETMEVMSAQ